MPHNAHSPTLPLADLRVLEFTQNVMGPSGGLVLADLGADVVKIEPAPQGDVTRRLGGFGAGFFNYLNRNKRSLAIDLKTAAGKKAFTDALLSTIRRLGDPIEQEHYLKQIAKLTDTSLDAVKAKFSNASTPQVILKKPKTITQLDKDQIEYQRLQDHLLAMMLMQPKLRPLINDCKAEFFTDGPPRRVFKFLKDNPDFKGDPKIAEQLQPEAEYVKILMLQFEEIYQDLPLEDLREQADHLRHRLIDRYVKIQKRQLVIAMQEAKDDNELNSLMQKADKLNTLIR